MKRKTKKCTEERVQVQASGDYCKMCYNGMTDKKLTFKEKRTLCNKTNMGCGKCEVLVCEKCWKTYDHTI